MGFRRLSLIPQVKGGGGDAFSDGSTKVYSKRMEAIHMHEYSFSYHDMHYVKRNVKEHPIYLCTYNQRFGPKVYRYAYQFANTESSNTFTVKTIKG
jgi:hypothetical protein